MLGSHLEREEIEDTNQGKQSDPQSSSSSASSSLSSTSNSSVSSSSTHNATPTYQTYNDEQKKHLAFLLKRIAHYEKPENIFFNAGQDYASSHVPDLDDQLNIEAACITAAITIVLAPFAAIAWKGMHYMIERRDRNAQEHYNACINVLKTTGPIRAVLYALFKTNSELSEVILFIFCDAGINEPA